jgi:hypothetical protein
LRSLSWLTAAFVLLIGAAAALQPRPTTVPVTITGPVSNSTLHFTGVGNWDAQGNYLPASLGFNLAGVGSPGVMPYVPTGVQALVWIGLCNGADATFQSAVNPYLGNSKVWGYYVFDDAAPGTCAAANLMAECDWIHTNDVGRKCFIELAAQGTTANPSYAGYNESTTHGDYFGIALYPCHSDVVNTCNYNEIGLRITAAQNAGIATADIVPIYQTFCCGSWTYDTGVTYTMPTVGELAQTLITMQSLLPSPVFDYNYHYDTQSGDQGLVQAPNLQPVVQHWNGK